MLITTVVGMQLATPSWVPWQILVFGTLGIGLIASSAAAINHLVDYRIDIVMTRTQRRPLPKGKVAPRNALLFALLLAAIGTYILVSFVNVLTAVLTLSSLVGYAIIYTMFLKRATPQNIVIGGLAGATPPLLGWTAVTGQIDPQSLLLVLIIFTWTPPHFWSLAIHRQEDYAKANVPMLPVTHGIPFTKLHVLLYTFLLTAVSFMPFVTGMSGSLYMIGALILDAGFIYYAIALLKSTDNKIAIKSFHYSNFYLLMLFVCLLVDHYVVGGV